MRITNARITVVGTPLHELTGLRVLAVAAVLSGVFVLTSQAKTIALTLEVERV